MDSKLLNTINKLRTTNVITFDINQNFLSALLDIAVHLGSYDELVVGEGDRGAETQSFHYLGSLRRLKHIIYLASMIINTRWLLLCQPHLM